VALSSQIAPVNSPAPANGNAAMSAPPHRLNDATDGYAPKAARLTRGGTGEAVKGKQLSPADRVSALETGLVGVFGI
jgi:hypothetical protein